VLDLVVVFLFTHPVLAVLSRNKSFGTSAWTGLGRVDRRRSSGVPASGADRELVASGAPRTGQNRSKA